MIHLCCHTDDFSLVKKYFFSPELWRENHQALQSEAELMLPWFAANLYDQNQILSRESSLPHLRWFCQRQGRFGFLVLADLRAEQDKVKQFIGHFQEIIFANWDQENDERTIFQALGEINSFN